MPELEKELEAGDPYELVAQRYQAEPGTDPDELMARCFIEEYALMGFPREKIMRLFRSESFAATHSVLESRGEQFVSRLLDSVFPAQTREAL
jgi:hypothetical protein